MRLYIACGFNPENDNVIDILTKDESDGGVFLFNNADKENINKVNFRGLNTFKEKAIEMIAYLLELAFDISIAPRDNISSSPGFELPLGIFGGSSD